jgi:hypothetical protein
VTGLTEGVNWLILALLFLLYIRGNRIGVAVLLAISVLQRETIPVTMGAIAVTALLLGYGSQRYNGFVLAASLAAFAAYLVLRKYVIAAPGFEEQLSPAHLLRSLASFRPTRQMVVQGLLSQNVLAICLTLGLLRFFATRRLPPLYPVLLAAFVVLIVIGVAEGIGNNIGRIAGILTPLYAAAAAVWLREAERGVAEALPHGGRPQMAQMVPAVSRRRQEWRRPP